MTGSTIYIAGKLLVAMIGFAASYKIASSALAAVPVRVRSATRIALIAIAVFPVVGLALMYNPA